MIEKYKGQNGGDCTNLETPGTYSCSCNYIFVGFFNFDFSINIFFYIKKG